MPNLLKALKSQFIFRKNKPQKSPLLFYTLLVLATSALVAGCADLAPTQVEPVSARTARICQENIALTGRFSAKHQKDGKDEAVHGGFEWVQSGKNAGLTLLSPLGQIVATIDIKPSVVTLTPAGAPPRTAADADALAAASLGWPLPVSGLGSWLQGCAMDTQGHRFVATPERNSVTTPDGWHIVYPVWEDATSTARRPKRIDLTRTGDGVAAEVSLRLVIDTWQPNRK